MCISPKLASTGFEGRTVFTCSTRPTTICGCIAITNQSWLSRSIALLRALEPDVVHFHHFLSIGLDLIATTRRILPSCRILLTFHEFAAICAADGHMVRRTDRSLCDHSSPVRCHQCIPDRQPDEFMIRKLWIEQHLSHVDHFTCPSRFMIEPFVTWGIPASGSVT